MKNVYDILVNFKKIPYEFYEWDKNDDIKHIKKIPSYKVDDLTLYDFINNEIIVSKEFLENIKERTEFFYNRTIKKVNYACIVFNEEVSLAVLFNETGEILGRSKLLFDEEEDVISSGKNLDVYEIKYNVIKIIKRNFDFTRNESKIILLLLKYLDKIYESNKMDELMYIYFECFNEKENDLKKAYIKLRQNIENSNFEVINKLKSLIKVLKK